MMSEQQKDFKEPSAEEYEWALNVDLSFGGEDFTVRTLLLRALKNHWNFVPLTGNNQESGWRFKIIVALAKAGYFKYKDYGTIIIPTDQMEIADLFVLDLISYIFLGKK